MSYHSIEFEQTECPNCSNHSIPFKKDFKCPYCGCAIDVYYDFVSEVVRAMLCHKEMYGSFFPDAWFSGPIAEQIEGDIFNFFDELEERKLERNEESINKILDELKYDSEEYKKHFKEIVFAVNDQYEIELKKKSETESHLKKATENDKLEIGPPLRLIGMIWIAMVFIYFLPFTIWAIVIKIILGLWVLIVIASSFKPFWDRYVTMGAFVTLQALWFAGLLWISEPIFLRYIFLFLIIIGVGAKFKQIKHINDGQGPELNKNSLQSDKIDPRKVKANIFVLESESFEIAEAYSKHDKEKEELLKFSTQSIKKIEPFFGIPPGFSLEFVATYPDVLLWWNSLSDEKQENFLKDFNEDDLFDENQKIKSKYLKSIIEAYKNTGATLECSYGVSE